MKFSVDYDRAKCQERVGKNGIENGLTVWILGIGLWFLLGFGVFQHEKNRTTMGKYQATILPDQKLLKCILFNQIVSKLISKCRDFILII